MKHKKTYNLQLTTYNSSQEGVTLVISIVMLATITFISFSLSTVILREIRTARLVLTSETAFAGANSGGEVSLYRLQRNHGDLEASNAALGQSGAQYDVVPDLTDIPYNFTISTGQTVIVNLYDADDYNSADPGYRVVQIDNNNGNTINAAVSSWATPETALCSPNISSGNSRVCNLTGPEYRYKVTITMSGSGSAAGSVWALDGSGANLGIPSAAPVIDVTGKRGEVKRRLQIKLSQ